MERTWLTHWYKSFCRASLMSSLISCHITCFKMNMSTIQTEVPLFPTWFAFNAIFWEFASWEFLPMMSCWHQLFNSYSLPCWTVRLFNDGFKVYVYQFFVIYIEYTQIDISRRERFSQGELSKKTIPLFRQEILKIVITWF